MKKMLFFITLIFIGQSSLFGMGPNPAQLVMVETGIGWVAAQKTKVYGPPVVVIPYQEILTPYIDPRLHLPQYQPQAKQHTSFSLGQLPAPATTEEYQWLMSQINYLISASGPYQFIDQDCYGNTSLHVAMDRLNLPFLERVFSTLSPQDKRYALSIASRLPMGVINGDTCLSDGDTIIHVAFKRLDYLLATGSDASSLISLLTILLPDADLLSQNFSTTKSPQDIFSISDFFERYLSSAAACAPLRHFFTKGTTSPVSSLSSDSGEKIKSDSNSINTTPVEKDKENSTVETDVEDSIATESISFDPQIRDLTDQTIKLVIAIKPSEIPVQITSEIITKKAVLVSPQIKSQQVDSRNRQSTKKQNQHKSQPRRQTTIHKASAKSIDPSKPTVISIEKTSKMSSSHQPASLFNEQIFTRSTDLAIDSLIQEVAQEIVQTTPKAQAGGIKSDSKIVETIVPPVVVNPLNEIFTIITSTAKKKLPTLETALKKHKKALKTARPWRNTEGKTLLCCALETNFMPGVDLLVQAIPELATQSNADGSLPIDYLLENATEQSIQSLFTNWYLEGLIDIDTTKVAGKTLRSRAEAAGLIAASKISPTQQSQASQKTVTKKFLAMPRVELSPQQPAIKYSKNQLKLISAITSNNIELLRQSDSALSALPCAFKSSYEENFITTAGHPYCGALMHAMMSFSIESFAYIASKIENINFIVDSDEGATPLHSAMLHALFLHECTSEKIAAILDVLCTHHSIKINHQDGVGTTALHSAATYAEQYDSQEKEACALMIVAKLLHHGANPTIKTIDDESPIVMALQNSTPSIIAMLMNHPGAELEALDCFFRNPAEEKLAQVLSMHPTILIEIARRANIALLPILAEIGAYDLIDHLHANGLLNSTLLLEKEDDSENARNALVIILNECLENLEKGVVDELFEIKKCLVDKLVSLASIDEWCGASSASDAMFIRTTLPQVYDLNRSIANRHK